jgi:O-antigen biosynthesis protein
VLPLADSLYDFTLRFVEIATRIQHLRQVLLHRPAGLSSPITAEQTEADIRAICGRLQRTGRSGTVVPNIPGFGSYDAHLNPTSEPLVSIIIPTAGKVVQVDGREIDLLVNCIDMILARSTYRNLEFIVIDNGDFDRGRLSHIATDRIKFTSFRETEFNVAKKLNIGAALASGSLFLLLNDDIEPLSDDWIERMMEHFQKPHVGVVGAKLLYPDRTTQHVGVVLNANNPDHVRRSASRDDTGYFFSSCSVRNYHAVTGAVMMTTKELYRQVGGYTEALAISFNDVDFSLKVGEHGFSVVYAPRAELIHFESQSREAKLNMSELIYFKHRWANFVSDSFYNELNLTVAPPTFEICHNARLI